MLKGMHDVVLEGVLDCMLKLCEVLLDIVLKLCEGVLRLCERNLGFPTGNLLVLSRTFVAISEKIETFFLKTTSSFLTMHCLTEQFVSI